MRLKYYQAINQALSEEMSRDPSVVLFGEDVARPGGPFGTTRGLLDAFGPMRVRDTPISELTLVGAGVGGALMGLRPVVEIMFSDFLCLAMDQLVNQAAKIFYMSDGRQRVPLTIRTICGTGGNYGPQHSQNLEAMFAHVPGLKVVWPTTPADVKGLLKAAIRDDNPVVVIESVSLMSSTGDVDEEDFVTPIGKASILQSGGDVTVVTAGGAVHKTQEACKALANKGIEVDLIDLRTIAPLDMETILASVGRTHRLAVIHDAVKTHGFGAEVAAQVCETAFDELQAPVRRIAARWAPTPANPILEAAYYPSADSITREISDLCAGSGGLHK